MKKLLIVVDYQNDFVNGSLGFSGAELLEEPILNKIKVYEESDHHIIYTFDTHDADYLETQEGKNLPIAHCLEKTEGHALFGKVLAHYQNKNDGKDFAIFKNTFGSVDLMKVLLDRKQYDVIELVGVVSYICVLSNAVIAKTAQPEAQIVVDSNCIAGPDQALHDACLALMSKALQMKVI